ncbi:RlpA-like double-psi beta-barrel-protein domain-containing protein-containing protein [Schizothecium vesticola]|uniref:RlpA-like double-psi beta-barrel-protein domain-containing protein-containing protein n=1 Tax=Schizothecium vesticola TaxID=314040 RepID=A0AA40K1R4_9PEZI|nr:RlpA-like double-psi beta-barrel-protein domain-containing protein-containing protein [Schizothecium vesticola]
MISVDKGDRRKVKAFCREYLGIPVATWYSTTVTPTETVQSTATAETTVVETTTITSVETVVSTSVQTVVVSTATYTIEHAITQRNAQPSSLPDILVAEYKPAALSSACSCLSLRKCTKQGGIFTASPTTTTVVSTLTVETTSVTSITEAATTTIGTTVTTGITTTTSVEPPPAAFTGDFTFYSTGLGSCGITHTDADYIVALHPMLFDPSTPPAGNPNQNTLCGRKIKASYGSKTVTVTVADRCEGCHGLNDLDLSPSAFQSIASPGEGRIHGTWEWA